MDSKDTFAYPAVGVSTGTSLGVQLATPSVDNTLASTFTVLSASLPDQADGFILSISAGYGSGTTSCLVDVYIGASGQEQLLVGGLRTGRSHSSGGAQKTIYVPLSIPAGSRVTARHQCNNVANSPIVWASFTPLGKGFSAEPSFGISEKWGVSAATSKGTGIVANASANILGTKTELIAATGFECRQIFLQMHPGTTGFHLITLYVGASGSEVPIFGQLQCNGAYDSGGGIEFLGVQGICVSLPLSVPAGSRISAAIQSTAGGATADVSVLAFG